MYSRSRLLLLAVLVGVGTLALAWEAAAQEPVTSRLKLSIGGYIKPEFVYRTNNGTPGFAGSVPGVQNFGFSATPQKNTTGGTNGEFAAASNETRFNFTLNAPDWRGLKSFGFLEMDFEGDTASTVERLGGVAPAAGIGNSAGSINNGAARIRHAFFRLSGEGMGGQWSLTFGQTWNVFGLLPFYSGSSVSFGGASLFGGRGTQLRVQHSWKVFRDFTWETAITASSDTTNFNEVPAGDIYGRWIYAGWQGFQGGSRTPLNFGVSARIQRQKADIWTLTGGLATTPNTSSQANGTRALSATAWGVTGGIFLPILPGRSATDRTWALSVVSEGGYGEGVNAQAIPGTNPLSASLAVGAPNRADTGAVFFKPSSCNAVPNPPTAFGGVSGTGLTIVGAALAACNNVSNGFGGLGSTALLPANGAITNQLVMVPTELSLIKTPWASYNVQFYLPYGFWISGGQKYIWFTNVDNAFAQTCLNVAPGPGACGASPAVGALAPNPLITPGGATGGVTFASQGRFNQAFVSSAQPCGGLTGVQSSCSALFGGRDAQIRRLTYSYVAAFYDMTPNIRWGFEWGMNGTNRKDHEQDNQSHRWQFAGYFFF